ncbi:MAG: carboxypeptidase-like regulatory domain-containing protein [Planctomycetota bacterium]
MRPEVARLAPFAIAVVVAVALGVSAWCWWSSVPLAPPALAAGEAAGAGLAAAASGATPTPLPAPVAATDLPRQVDEGVGLSGVVLDDLGAPLDRILVYLRQGDAKWGGVESCCSDARGRFRFPRAHGTVALTVEDGLVPGRELVLARGEPTFVELRAEQPCIALEGTVRRGAEPVADRFVFVRDASALDRRFGSESTDAEGRYRHLLHPGTYTIAVGADASSATGKQRDAGPSYPMGAVAIDASVRRVQRDFVLPCNGIEVRVRDAASHRPVAGVVIQVRTADGRSRHSGSSDDGGEVTFRELPPAIWHVSMESQQHAALADRIVEVAPDRTRAVEFAVTRAGAVRVGVRGLARAGDDPFAPLPQSPRIALHPTAGGPALGVFDAIQGELGFARVAPGRYELRADDLSGPQGWQYAPVAPFVAGPIDVVAGETTRFEVEAKRRASLYLAVRDSAGVPWPLHLTVTGPDGLVEVTPSWQGSVACVPPGDYRIAVEAPSGRIEERVAVADRDVGHVVVVPGSAPPREPFSDSVRRELRGRR